MASEYVKNKALIKRLKEPKIRNVDFGLGDPVNYVQNISDIYDNTDDKIKPFNNLDKTTYPSDPIQQRKLKDEKLFQNILPKLKIKGNKIKGKKTKADYSNFKIVDPKVTVTKSIPETPQEDVETIINRRAEQSRIRQRDNFIKSYGINGLPNVIANREGLFDE